MGANLPSASLRGMKKFLECINTTLTNIFNLLNPPTVTRTLTEVGAGAGSVPAGWISVTLINQGTTNATIDGGPVMLPGTTVSWDLKDFNGTADEISYLLAGAGSSLLIVEVR